jgi:5-formyltetrahydrofolate cyclo-ligase
LQAREDPHPTAGAVPFTFPVTSKVELRKEARAKRLTLVRAVPDFSRRIADLAPELPIKAGAVAAGYLPKDDEADPFALMAALEAQGHPLCLPAIVADKQLVFRSWHGGDPTAANVYGIGEPLAGCPELIPDVVLVPLLAFDRRGHRLGYGAGYYDRVLEKLRAGRSVLAIGIAYSGQEIAFIPHSSHDHPLDMLLSEKGMRWFDRPPR